jgi:PPOX class probable F420-dependent enzyme
MTTLDRVKELVTRENGLAVIFTSRADGTGQASIVNAGVLDHPVSGDPVVGFVVRGDTLKHQNLRSRPRVTAVFRVGWEWVAVEGDADLAGPDDELDGLDPGDVPRLLRDVFTAAGGTHDDWDEYDRVMKAEGRTAVLIEPARITSN